MIFWGCLLHTLYCHPHKKSVPAARGWYPAMQPYAWFWCGLKAMKQSQRPSTIHNRSGCADSSVGWDSWLHSHYPTKSHQVSTMMVIVAEVIWCEVRTLELEWTQKGNVCPTTKAQLVMWLAWLQAASASWSNKNKMIGIQINKNTSITQVQQYLYG